LISRRSSFSLISSSEQALGMLSTRAELALLACHPGRTALISKRKISGLAAIMAQAAPTDSRAPSRPPHSSIR
jgi:hypothetical protein